MKTKQVAIFGPDRESCLCVLRRFGGAETQDRPWWQRFVRWFLA